MPSRQGPQEDDDLGELPGFLPPAGLPPQAEHDPASPSPSTPNPTRPTSSTIPPSHPGPTEPAGPTPSGSLRTSIDTEVDHAIADLVGALFAMAGVGLNRLARRRTRRPTNQWLVSSEEADAFGTTLGNVASRRIPEELTEGDTGDAVSSALILVAYGARNLVGIPAEHIADVGPGMSPVIDVEPRVEASSSTTVPEQRAPAMVRRPISVETDDEPHPTTGVAPPEPEPPSVIDPNL